MTMTRVTLTILILTTWATLSTGQTNLVLNPSFEQLDICPTGTYQADTATYWGWVNNSTFLGNEGKGSLMSTCCTSPPYCSVPYNWFGYQKPRTGNSYVLLTSLYSFPPSVNDNHRDYIKGQLSSILQNGRTYCLTFYYNVSNYIYYTTNRFGAYVDNNSVASFNCCKDMPVTPQAQNNPSIFMTDTANWVKIQGSFTASGNENTITIGNFVDSATVQFQLFNSSGIRGPYFAIDDISLIPIDLAPYAGKDTSITLGDSAYIGRTNEVGLNDDCTWYLLGNATSFDTVAGLWIKPNTIGIHSYVVEQNICGTITYDTVVVTINPVGILNNEKHNSKFTVYPNPTSDQSILQFDNTKKEICMLTLYNNRGQIVRTVNNITSDQVVIQKNNLTNGLYYFVLRTGDRVIVTGKLAVD